MMTTRLSLSLRHEKYTNIASASANTSTTDTMIMFVWDRSGAAGWVGAKVGLSEGPNVGSGRGESDGKAVGDGVVTMLFDSMDDEFDA